MNNQDQGQEKEKNIRKNRMLFGSTPEPKIIRIDTNRPQLILDDLSKHIESCPDEEISSRKTELPHLLIHMGVGLILAAVGAILLFLLWPSYSNSNATIPGATILFFGGGVVLLVGGPIYVLYRLYDFFRGPRLSTPNESVETFIKSLENRNWDRIWNCMTPLARSLFETSKDYKKYLKSARKKIEEETEKSLGTTRKVDESLADSYKVSLICSLEHENLHLSTLSENACRAEFDLVVKQIRSIDKKSATGGNQYIEDGKAILPQSKGLVLCGEDWLLTSGIIDTPWDDKSPSEE